MTKERVDPPLLSLCGWPHKVTYGWEPGEAGAIATRRDPEESWFGCMWKATGGDIVGWGETRKEAMFAWAERHDGVIADFPYHEHCPDCGKRTLYEKWDYPACTCASCGAVTSHETLNKLRKEKKSPYLIDKVSDVLKQPYGKRTEEGIPAGADADFDADKGVTTMDGRVTAWADQTGNMIARWPPGQGPTYEGHKEKEEPEHVCVEGCKEDSHVATERPLIPDEARRIGCVLTALYFAEDHTLNMRHAEQVAIRLLRTEGFPIDALIQDLGNVIDDDEFFGSCRSRTADILAKYDAPEPKQKPPEPDCAPPLMRNWGTVGGQWK